MPHGHGREAMTLMGRRRVPGWTRMYLLAVLLLLLVGCEEDVVAVLDTERAFSLFGVISPQLDSQWVRVFPIEGQLVPAAPEPLAAQFTSTDLTSGEVWTWRDSLLVDPNDQYAHVFWAPFQGEFGHRYRLVAEDGAGNASQVEVAVPVEAALVVQEPTVVASQVIQPVLVDGEVPRLLKIEVDYIVGFFHIQVVGGATRSLLEADTVRIVSDGRQQQVAGGWLIRIDLSADFRKIEEEIRKRWVLDRSRGIELLQIEMRLMVVNEAWNPPEGVFDPEVLVQAGTLTNVENGFGFVGAGYRLQHAWVPSDEVASAAGFRTQ